MNSIPRGMGAALAIVAELFLVPGTVAVGQSPADTQRNEAAWPAPIGGLSPFAPVAGSASAGDGPAPAASSNGLAWHILQNPNGPHTVLLIDPSAQVLAVYHVDVASGAIKLMSIRNIHWDLRIEDYNSSKPAPQDIRAMQP